MNMFRKGHIRKHILDRPSDVIKHKFGQLSDVYGVKRHGLILTRSNVNVSDFCFKLTFT